MSQFNSRDEYERWKAERMSRSRETPSKQPDLPADEQSTDDGDSEATEKAIRQAWQLGTFIGFVTLAFVIAALWGYPVLSHTAWDLLDVAFIFLLSFGVYKKNRTAALLLFFYFIISKILMTIETGKYTGLGAAAIFGYFLFNGVRGTFAYHKDKETDGDGLAWKPVVAACLVAGALTALIFIGKKGQTNLFPAADIAKAADWRDVAPDGAGFRISMPGEPVRNSKTISLEGGAGTIQVQSYSVQMSSKISYAVLYYDLPEAVSGSADVYTLYQRVTDSGVADLKGKLVSEKVIFLGSWPGKEVHAENDQDAFRAVMFLVNGRFYHMIANRQKGQIQSDDVERFLSSFKLTTSDGQIIAARDTVAAWLDITPPGARFSVQLPGTPAASQENAQTSAGNMIVYRFELKRDDVKEHYSVQYADYPAKLLEKMKTPDVVLDSAGSADIENFKGTLASRATLTSAPCPARELHIENAESVMRLRMYLKDGRVYKVAAVGPKNMMFTADDDRFMNSFRFVSEDGKSQ